MSAHGTLIVVVGPSGSGKDTVIDYARERFSQRRDVLFVRRTVTRDTGSGGEDHDVMTSARFVAAQAGGAFSLTWEAHGLRYGLPITLADHLDRGGVAVANGSRAALDHIKKRFARVCVVGLKVSSDILAQRLRARGRESEEEIADRLRRAAKYDVGEAMTIPNDGPIETAGEKLVACIEKCLTGQPVDA